MDEKTKKNKKIKYAPITSAKCDVYTEFDDEGDTIVRIDSIKIAKINRHKGLGTLEVKSIIEWAKSNGAKGIVIESFRKAIPFWEKMGFDVCDQGSKVSTGFFKL
jgi:GNAT superfamily N-acetyltransferase